MSGLFSFSSFSCFFFSFSLLVSRLSSFYWPVFSCCTLFLLSFAVCSCVVLRIMLYCKKECSCSFYWCFSTVCLRNPAHSLRLSVFRCVFVSVYTVTHPNGKCHVGKPEWTESVQGFTKRLWPFSTTQVCVLFTKSSLTSRTFTQKCNLVSAQIFIGITWLA